MEIKIHLNECGDCHSIFGTETKSDVVCCPICKKEDITCVGNGTITDIVEH